VAGHPGGADAAERRPRGRPSTAGFHQFGPCLRRGSGGRLCPIPPVRAPPAALLLCCLQDSVAWLAPDASSSPVECSLSPCALPARREAVVGSDEMLAKRQRRSPQERLVTSAPASPRRPSSRDRAGGSSRSRPQREPGSRSSALILPDPDAEARRPSKPRRRPLSQSHERAKRRPPPSVGLSPFLHFVILAYGARRDRVGADAEVEQRDGSHGARCCNAWPSEHSSTPNRPERRRSSIRAAPRLTA
jgi:hypothetical protein